MATEMADFAAKVEEETAVGLVAKAVREAARGAVVLVWCHPILRRTKAVCAQPRPCRRMKGCVGMSTRRDTRTRLGTTRGTVHSREGSCTRAASSRRRRHYSRPPEGVLCRILW